MTSAPPSAALRIPGLRVWAVVILLLGMHVCLGLVGKKNWSVTSDESAHLLAGQLYWEKNDYRLQPENGNLPQRIEGLPAWIAGRKLPSEANPYWEISEVWMLGHSYLHQLGNDEAAILFWGRAMNMIWSVGCGLLIFCWSRSLFGDWGALLSLTFYCLDPTFLAHGFLATSDMCATFFLLAALGAWWRHLKTCSVKSGLLSAITFGLACVAKFSAVLLIPMFILLAVWHEIAAGASQRRTGKILVSMLAHGAAATLIIWASFGFRYSAAAPGMPAMEQFIVPWEQLLPAIGMQGKIVAFLRDMRALPEGFLFGYTHVLAYAQQRGAFLDGNYSIHGWVTFFPLAFLYKSPTPLLVALPLALGLLLRRWKQKPSSTISDLTKVAPLVMLFVTYGAFSLTAKLNIGQRHILPLYPVLFIFVGWLGYAASKYGRKGFWILLFPAWSALVIARIHPHELAYFNPIAGGPKSGFRHLVDSSLDWGQDLPGLKFWLDENRRPEEPLYLSYFGTGYPKGAGIDAVLMPTINDFSESRPWHFFKPGLYAISATMLQHVYSDIQGPWTLANEQEYQKGRFSRPGFQALIDAPDGHPELFVNATEEQWIKAWNRFEKLRFARLCHYLRARTPEAMIGYSIFVYRLDQTELDAALEGPFSELSAAIEKAAAH